MKHLKISRTIRNKWVLCNMKGFCRDSHILFIHRNNFLGYKFLWNYFSFVAALRKYYYYRIFPNVRMYNSYITHTYAHKLWMYIHTYTVRRVQITANFVGSVNHVCVYQVYDSGSKDQTCLCVKKFCVHPVVSRICILTINITLVNLLIWIR